MKHGCGRVCACRRLADTTCRPPSVWCGSVTNAACTVAVLRLWDCPMSMKGLALHEKAHCVAAVVFTGIYSTVIAMPPTAWVPECSANMRTSGRTSHKALCMTCGCPVCAPNMLCACPVCLVHVLCMTILHQSSELADFLGLSSRGSKGSCCEPLNESALNSHQQ